MNRFESSLSLQGLFSGDSRKPTVILLSAPFILTTFKYYGSKSFYLTSLSSSFVLFGRPEQTGELYTFFSSFVLLGLVPLGIIRFVLRESLASYGLQIGDWKFGLKALAVLAPVMALATIPSSRMPQFLAEYPLFKGACESPLMFGGHALSYLFFYIGWEIFFRGYMQFGLRAKFGELESMLVQTLASCLLHIGKPDGEIYGSIIGGIVWGIVAFRARSIVPIIIVHWLLGISLDFFICYAH